MTDACKVLTKGPGTQRILSKWQLASPHPFLAIVSASLAFPLHFGQIQTLPDPEKGVVLGLARKRPTSQSCGSFLPESCSLTWMSY